MLLREKLTLASSRLQVRTWKGYLGNIVSPPWHSQMPATAEMDLPCYSPWKPSPEPESSSTHSKWLELIKETHDQLQYIVCKLSWGVYGSLRTSFIDVSRNLNSCVGIVDIVLEVWVVYKLQLDVRGVFHFSFSIHRILSWENTHIVPLLLGLAIPM